jgi:hypothetical protein
MKINMNVFEEGRSPEFIEEMKRSAIFTNKLAHAVESGELSLDEAAQQLIDSSDGWSGTFADARRFLAPGPRKSRFP